MIVQRLREIQNRHGYLPDAELTRLAKEMDVPLYRLEEVASFFPSFRQERNPPPNVEIKVCRDMSCHLRGSAKLLAPEGLPALAADLEKRCGRSVRVEGVSCLGRCDRAPAVWIERHAHTAHDHADKGHHEHGWVYTGRNQEQLTPILTAISEGQPRPDPNSDRTYAVNTNVSERDTAALPAPLWEINVYGQLKEERSYRAVRKFVDELLKPYARLSVPFPTQPKLPGEPKAREEALKAYNDLLDKTNPMLVELRKSGLFGMGGAGVPAYQKWLDVWKEASVFDEPTQGDAGNTAGGQRDRYEKYIVANGDESEPGTFKDRELMLRLPHLVIEGVILAGLMTGATAGYIYVRHEFHEQIMALRAEIFRAEELGACGPNIFKSGRGFSVTVIESPGGYICGEQSALIEAMEDRRSQPRNKPPEITTNGFRDRPTIVNNIETLSWAPYIMIRGGDAYARHGAPIHEGSELRFKGRRLFSISGDVNRPGVYEVPVGLTLRQLIENPKYCDGMVASKNVGFVATSGPSGGLLPARIPISPKARQDFERAISTIEKRSKTDAVIMQAFLEKQAPPDATHFDLLAVPLDLTFFRNLQTVFKLAVEPMLGAGIVVYAEGRDPLDQAVNFSRFFRNESCGKCVPCRIGSHKLTNIGLDLLQRREKKVTDENAVDAVRSDVLEIMKAMQQTSICGLGYVAPLPLSSVFEYFPNAIR